MAVKSCPTQVEQQNRGQRQTKTQYCLQSSEICTEFQLFLVGNLDFLSDCVTVIWLSTEKAGISDQTDNRCILRSSKQIFIPSSNFIVKNSWKWTSVVSKKKEKINVCIYYWIIWLVLYHFYIRYRVHFKWCYQFQEMSFCHPLWIKII